MHLISGTLAIIASFFFSTVNTIYSEYFGSLNNGVLLITVFCAALSIVFYYQHWEKSKKS